MKTFRQLLEDIQVGPAPEKISYKGYTTKNLHHVPDAAKAFQATITRVQKSTLQDNGEVLAALKATDTYMKLNDMHLKQEKDLDSQELDQWLAAHEEAKSALTKIGEFEHHYDYWNSHNAELQYLKANQNMPQEAESVQIEEGPYSSGQLKASPEQLKQANKVPSGGRTTTIVDRDAKGVYTLTMKDGKEVSKVYKESTEIAEELDFKKEAAKHMKDVYSSNVTQAVKQHAAKMVRRALEASRMKDKAAAHKHYMMGEEVELEEASKLQGTPVVSLSDFGRNDNTKNKYGQTVPKKLKPNDPRVKMYTEPKKEGVAEGLADDFLAMAKNRNPNARIVTAVQKRKETEELMKKREASGTKPAQAAPTSNPRPLGGHDPKSGRSYSESVELDEAVKKKLAIGSKVSHPVHGKGMVVMHSLGGGTSGTVVKFADGKKVRVDHKKLKMEEVELEELRNVTQDQLGSRMGSSGPGFNKTPAGKEREVKRKQEHLKGQMQYTKSQGGIAGPKGKLPEQVELDEKTLTPAELKKREEVAKAMERKNPNMDKSRKMAIATAVAKRVAEQYDDVE